MPLQYSCFISYCHGDGELMQRFIDDLTEALRGELTTYLDEQLYIDKQRLMPGHLYNEVLAKALCQSVCMIVVYVPKYERHPYCRREFEAMERIEARRKSAIKRNELREKGMIIPIVLRGDAPEKIRRRSHFLDFSKYTTASPKIGRNKKYTDEIKKIAKYIDEVHTELRRAGDDLCADCDEFPMPAEQDVPLWNPAPAPPPYPR